MGSNHQHSDWKSDALPLSYTRIYGGPGGDRTRDQGIMSPLLVPTELQARKLLLVVEFSQCVTDNNSLPQVYRNLPNKTPTCSNTRNSVAHFTQLADDIAGEHDSPSFPVGTLFSVQSTVEFGRLSRNQTLTRGLEGPYAILYTNSPLNVVYKTSLTG